MSRDDSLVAALFERICTPVTNGVPIEDPNWLAQHRRYYRIADITIQLESDLPITDLTFEPRFRTFQVDAPGDDVVVICHHFAANGLPLDDPRREVYRRPPWAIYRREDGWTYAFIGAGGPNDPVRYVARLTLDHTHIVVYHKDEGVWRGGEHRSLSLFPTDQILVARWLADRHGCYLHSAGAILNGKGLLFVGHSEAGKTTTVNMLQDRAEILCDDRNIVRQIGNQFHVYGTWSHGESPLVSAASAPLGAILFLSKSSDNCLAPLTSRNEIVRRLLACVIRPFATPDWWTKTLDVIEGLAQHVPCYEMRFDMSGEVVTLLHELGGRDALHFPVESRRSPLTAARSVRTGS